MARDDGPFYHDKLSVKWMLGNNSDNLLKDSVICHQSRYHVKQIASEFGLNKYLGIVSVCFEWQATLLVVNRKTLAFLGIQSSNEAVFLRPWNSWHICLCLCRVEKTHSCAEGQPDKTKSPCWLQIFWSAHLLGLLTGSFRLVPKVLICLSETLCSMEVLRDQTFGGRLF